MNEKLAVNLNPVMKRESGALPDEDQKSQIGKRKFLHMHRPDVWKLYTELIEQSWHPSGFDADAELLLEENNDAPLNNFNQWKDQYRREAELNKQVRELETKLNRNTDHLKKVQEELSWMKKTRFWRIRNAWHKIKSIAGRK
jgi:hypothetical protein